MTYYICHSSKWSALWRTAKWALIYVCWELFKETCSVQCLSTWGVCRSLSASSRRTAQPEPPGAPPPDRLLGTSGLSIGKERESQRNINEVYFHMKSLKQVLRKTWTHAWRPNLWVSLWVCGTAPWPSLHWGTKRGREQGPRSHSSPFLCLLFFEVKFGSDLQCVEGLSTPPRLSLHIHDVWLQLHHLLLQFAHLGLDTHTRVLVFLKHMWTFLTRAKKHTQLYLTTADSCLLHLPPHAQEFLWC